MRAARWTSRPDVAVADDRRLARVQAHADAQRESLERALARPRRRDRIVCACERVEQGVALRVHLTARAECFAKPAPVFLEQRPVLVRTEVSEELRRPLDVREQKRDGAARQLIHRLVTLAGERSSVDTLSP